MDVETDDAQPTFKEKIKIWPHRSLSKRGFAIVLIALGSLAFAIGVGFFLAGAWPVFGFLGVEFLVVYVAFKMNYRAAQKRQSITVTDKTLRIDTTHPSGKHETASLPTPWVKVTVSPGEAPDITSRYQQKITVSSHGQSVIVADFVHPAETPQLARHISGMIDRARNAAMEVTPKDVLDNNQRDGDWKDSSWAESLDEKSLRPN